MMNVGISLYLGTGYDKNKEIIEKAKRAKVSYAFTSLHLPEEKVEDYKNEVNSLLRLCSDGGIKLIVDIGPRTIEKLGLNCIQELKTTPITHIRPDYGFSMKEISELSKDFYIVFNASTLSSEELQELKSLGTDFSKLLAGHNFYPKPLTGLSLERVREINLKLRYQGIKTQGFIAGDLIKRGPLFDGLPTVEEHRYEDGLLSILQLRSVGACDIVLVGDVDITPELWDKIGRLNEGYVELPAKISEEYSFVKDMIHHDRPDSSSFIIRSQESRGYASEGKPFKKEGAAKRDKGTITIGNEEYLRYSGELEIARIDLNPEEKVNVIGKVEEGYLKYLDYIDEGLGFKFVDGV